MFFPIFHYSKVSYLGRGSCFWIFNNLRIAMNVGAYRLQTQRSSVTLTVGKMMDGYPVV